VSDVCRRTAKVWEGGLVLKNSLFPTRLHLLDGSRHISDVLKDEDGKNHLKITQRLRLDQVMALGKQEPILRLRFTTPAL
jgi:RNA-binding protein 15